MDFSTAQHTAEMCGGGLIMVVEFVAIASGLQQL